MLGLPNRKGKLLALHTPGTHRVLSAAPRRLWANSHGRPANLSNLLTWPETQILVSAGCWPLSPEAEAFILTPREVMRIRCQRFQRWFELALVRALPRDAPSIRALLFG